MTISIVVQIFTIEVNNRYNIKHLNQMMYEYQSLKVRILSNSFFQFKLVVHNYEVFVFITKYIKNNRIKQNFN